MFYRFSSLSRAIGVAVLALFLATSCSVPMNQAALQDQLASHRLTFEPGPAELVAPVRLGIAPPLRTLNDWYSQQTRFEAWRSDEREVMSAYANRLADGGFVESVRFLPQLLMGDDANTLAALREAGRSAGVDAVLVTHAVTEADQRANVLTLLDLTLVGAFVFPGHHGRARSLVEGVVIEVATGRVWTFAQGEGEAATTTAFAYLDLEELRHDAYVASLEDLGRALSAAVAARIGRAAAP